jgi:hypothetical protein
MFSDRFLADWQNYLENEYVVHGLDEVARVSAELIPDFFVYREKLYVRRP